MRLPQIFAPVEGEVLARFGASGSKRLGADYHLIKTATPVEIHRSEAAKFARWNLPVEHAWPCNPRKMDGFIEKAAQGMLAKFGERDPQGLFIGQLNAGSPDRYYKRLASNLRGRALQLFDGLRVKVVEEQDPEAATLFCLVGREGLFCGMQAPRVANGLFPGGSKFVDKSSPGTISRAGAKIAEALHYLLMHRPPLAVGSHWLELGACPGGMTSELLAREFRVTAIDRAPLDARLDRRKGLRFVRADVAEFMPAGGTCYDAILDDMNGPPEESIGQVIRLAEFLRPGGLVVFTLKVPRIDDVERACALCRKTVAAAASGGLGLVAQTHLTYNRHEFTLFFEKLGR